MDVIANIDRTIDGVSRRAGERFSLPDDTDLVTLGVVRAANPPAAGAPEAAEDYPPGYQGLRRAPKAADPLDHDGNGQPGGSLPGVVSTASKGRRRRA